MTQYWEPPEGGVGGPEPLSSDHEPEERTDKEITEGARAALLLDPDLSTAQIAPSTRDGVVELRGRVASEELRQRALDVVAGVRGVRDVEDHLRVEAA